MTKFLHLYREDNGFHIADRTISLRYRQFRTPRKDNRELILGRCKTHLLSDIEIQKYLRCNENREISNVEDKIFIDTEGFSIEMAKKLGNNYLKNSCILVSTRQEECDSIRGGHRKNTIIRKIFNTNRNMIEQLLMGEAIVGTEKQKDLDTIIFNPDSLFNIEMTFDTPNNAVSKLKNIRKDERILLESSGKLKDREFLKSLLYNIEDVSTYHGSLDRIPDKEIHIKEKTNFNKLRIDDIDIYCLKPKENTIILIYFSDNDREIYMNDDIIILNGKNTESLRILIELGIVGYSTYLGLERAASMTLRYRKGRKEKIETKEKIENLDIPERAKELLSTVGLLIENNRNKDFFINLDHNKMYMVYPLIQNDILYELLTRMENNDYKSYYMDTEKFISTVSNMENEKVGDFLMKILDSLEFVEENNTMVNLWLRENKKDICDNLGIKFVQFEKA